MLANLIEPSSAVTPSRDSGPCAVTWTPASGRPAESVTCTVTVGVAGRAARAGAAGGGAAGGAAAGVGAAGVGGFPACCINAALGRGSPRPKALASKGGWTSKSIEKLVITSVTSTLQRILLQFIPAQGSGNAARV